jgi:hypothetical protein
MIPLSDDLQTPKNSLKEFSRLTGRILSHIENVITGRKEIRGYNIYSSTSAGITKYTRPVNRDLFFLDGDAFRESFASFIDILGQLERRRGDIQLEAAQLRVIDSVTYTIQQAAGVGLDLLVNPNSARKHVGNRFEELVRLIVAELGIINKKIVLKIPYSDDGKDVYSCETDLVFSPFPLVKSHSTYIDPKEVVVSLKTSSKDRMGKIFIDKLLMKEFVGHDIKVVGIFLNDVQRKETDNISFTFVSGLFMVYTKFLTRSEGMYFVDLPPMAKQPPYNQYIFPFSKFVSHDIWDLVLRP